MLTRAMHSRRPSRENLRRSRFRVHAAVAAV